MLPEAVVTTHERPPFQGQSIRMCCRHRNISCHVNYQPNQPGMRANTEKLTATDVQWPTSLPPVLSHFGAFAGLVATISAKNR